MLTVFTCTRYVIFALSIICNAIIASVAVWNLSFVQTLDITYPLDTYLIFLGTFGLALVFVIVAVELVVQQSVTGRVWFECIWIGMLCIMNIVGASYLTANEPPLCNTRARILLGPHSCVSTQVLLGFTWSHTALLFWYFTLLTAFCLVRQTSEPGIWHSYIRDISNPVLFRRLTGNDTPAQPLPKFLPEKKFSVPIIAAPKPRRPPPPRDTITGLQTYYDVEPYTHDPHKHPPLPSSTIFPMTPGLYSQQVQSAIPAFPAAARTMYPPERRRTPSPPPLGDWPRADIISRPTPRKTTRKVTTLERVPEPDFIDDGSPSHRLVRPGGPRMRSESASRPRPPPLDLSKGKARGS